MEQKVEKMIKNIVIVEDDVESAEQLSSYIHQYFDNIGQPVLVRTFNSSLEALEKQTCHEDLYFLDIDLPHLNGMDLAKNIREKDEDVIIIFCSNLAQFALRGYEVSAFDYIVKPFAYSNIEHRLARATNTAVNHVKEKIVLKVSTSENVIINCDSIIYIEKERNYIVFHTSKQDYWVRGSLQEYEKVLPKDLFSYCTKGVCVNLSYVEKTTGNSVVLKDKTLNLARQRKKEFVADLFRFFGSKTGD